MPKYRATVRLSGLEGEDAEVVRRRLAAELRRLGPRELRVHVERDIPGHGVPAPPIARRARGRVWRQPRQARRGDGGGLLLVIAITWAIWFFWFLTE